MTLEEVTTLKEAIKRLKEVIKEVRSTIQPFLYDNEAKDYILKALEQPKWIPISERLPETHQDVLLSLRSVDVLVGFRAETEPYFYCHGDYIEPQNVLAWMPLPEPYKAESEE